MLNKLVLSCASAAAAALAFAGPALAETDTASTQPPPIEVYGQTPAVRSVALSDNGQKIASLRNDETGDYVLVQDYSNGDQTGFRVDGFKPINVDFIGDRYVLLRASSTELLLNSSGDFEYGFSFLFDTETDEVHQLLDSVGNILPGSSIHRVIGVLEESGELLVPAWTYPAASSAVNGSVAGGIDVGSSVFRVKPDTGRARVFEGDRQSGRMQTGAGPKYEHTIDWVIDPGGTVLGREDYDQATNNHRIYTKRGGSWRKIYQNDPSDTNYIGGYRFSLVGSAAAGDGLILSGVNQEMDEDALFHLSYDGEITGPMVEKDGRDVGAVLSDDNRRVFGVSFSGVTSEYEFFDPELDAAFKALQAKMVGFNLHVRDWSVDQSKLLLKVSGNAEAGSYYLFGVATGKLSPIAKTYDVAAEWVGQMQTIEYPAADGLMIPAIITWPAGDGDADLPLVVIPHGGPQAHDTMRFDWLAQYFASRGYMVFQPNFRGSTGFGDRFQRAGYGEWGQAMQDDVHAGVNALVSMGWVDADKICMVGGSYGGYAALAGGMTEPDLFTCIAAIAPVTDLPSFLSETRRDYGYKSYTYEFWNTSMGRMDEDAEELRAVSPARHADAFQAPVLLVHGRDDTVVSLAQSRKMRDALNAAGKQVTLVELDGGDHWLSTTETRLATLQEVAAFVEAHIGGAQ